MHIALGIFAILRFMENNKKHAFLLHFFLVQNRDSYSLQQFRVHALFHSKKHNKKCNKNDGIEYQWVQKSMQKACKKQAKIMHFLLPERQTDVQFQHGPRL